MPETNDNIDADEAVAQIIKPSDENKPKFTNFVTQVLDPLYDEGLDNLMMHLLHLQGFVMKKHVTESNRIIRTSNPRHTELNEKLYLDGIKEILSIFKEKVTEICTKQLNDWLKECNTDKESEQLIKDFAPILQGLPTFIEGIGEVAREHHRQYLQNQLNNGNKLETEEDIKKLLQTSACEVFVNPPSLEDTQTNDLLFSQPKRRFIIKDIESTDATDDTPNNEDTNKDDAKLSNRN